ncbi:vacuolar ATPase assembly protein VMA22-like [Tubulanus polymorphus]|uniref:vacuolar ATPase assembly protein VMA22-like n=1 Tax=Tubulanus polymorphus TaxID=672921 RepID=UPI003DA52B51
MAGVDLSSSVYGATNLEEICEALDNIACKYFETLEELNETRDEIHISMKDGFLYMSKSRYSMGNKWVRADQYNTKMKSDSKVSVALSEDKFGIICTRYEPFAVMDAIASDTCTKNDSGLRKRKNTNFDHIVKANSNGIAEDFAGLTVHGNSNDDKQEVEIQKDPITWFGLLVPQALRRCQTQFKDAIMFIPRIASLQARLIYLRNIFHELTKQKVELREKESSEDNINETP